jgi:hypothetical protein
MSMSLPTVESTSSVIRVISARLLLVARRGRQQRIVRFRRAPSPYFKCRAVDSTWQLRSIPRTGNGFRAVAEFAGSRRRAPVSVE